MRLQHIILAYFLIGAVLWAGGAIQWQQVGIGSEFIEPDSNGAVSVNESRVDQFSQQSGVLGEVTQSVVGAFVVFFTFIGSIIGYLFWPVTVLASVDAPVEVTVVMGGSVTVAFWRSILGAIR